MPLNSQLQKQNDAVQPNAAMGIIEEGTKGIRTSRSSSHPTSPNETLVAKVWVSETIVSRYNTYRENIRRVQMMVAGRHNTCGEISSSVNRDIMAGPWKNSSPLVCLG
jgi:hypothetical protein